MGLTHSPPLGKKTLVSPQFEQGAPETMAEVRLVSNNTEGCALLYHIAHSNYKVLKAGTLHCETKHRQSWSKELKEGMTLVISDTDSCSNQCISVGPAQYAEQHRKLGVIPSVHPTLIREAIDKQKNIYSHSHSKHSKTRVETDITRHMAQLKQEIEEIKDNDSIDTIMQYTSSTHTVTWTALSLALLCPIAAFLLCLRVRLMSLAACCLARGRTVDAPTNPTVCTDRLKNWFSPPIHQEINILSCCKTT